jgi:hypothetical protein
VSPFGDHEARRITLKRAFSDGTIAIDVDPLSLLCRLAAAVPYPRFSPFGDHEARRITLKRAFSDGTIAIDVDPLSLLCRLAAAVPYPRFSPVGDHEARHTVRDSGVLASASKVRLKIAPKQPPGATEGEDECVHSAPWCELPAEVPKRGPYRPWAELLKRLEALPI